MRTNLIKSFGKKPYTELYNIENDNNVHLLYCTDYLYMSNDQII